MPRKTIKDTFEEARNYVFRLLKIRFRSEKEVRDKLQQKGFSQETIARTVGYFKELDLVNDRQFAQEWIASRLSSNKPFGIHRIRFELKEKGIGPDLIEEEFAQATADYCEEDVVFRLAQRQAAKCRNVGAPKRKQRVYGYLMRRGFNPQVVLKAIKNL